MTRILVTLMALAAVGATLVILLDRGDAPSRSAEATTAPILTYHAISEPPASARHRDLFVDADHFTAQMTWLREHGYEAVTLDELYDGWKEGSALPAKPVVVSFDDGLQTQFTQAFPLLRDLDWPGVLNLKAESLRQGELTEAMVGRMVAAGWEVSSHTITHPKLTTLGARELGREVAGSRRILAESLDVAVDFFCYPYGKLDPRVVEAVRRAGYLGATTTRRGLASETTDPFRLPRLRVDRSVGIADFAAKIHSPEADA